MSSATAGSALAAAGAVGPYFAWDAWAGETGWRPFADLLDGDVAGSRVAGARSTLVTTYRLSEDAVPVRVVASITFLGIVSRLVSPPLGAAVAGGVLPLAGRDDLWWRPVPSGPLPVAYRGGQALPCGGLDARTVAEALVRSAVAGPVSDLLAVFRDRFRLSPQVLWGNVASALAGAAGVLAGADRPYAERAGAIVEHAFAQPPLAGTGTLVQPDPARARRFLVRRSCCLYYRIPGGGTCADCVLTPGGRAAARGGGQAAVRELT
ncbi:(2Fe-2S)-binding protein [Phytohabitans flavus]|uniref:Ferric siderophore reductase C-terminal domain-containing protein n=1 Tax=Phytohabitans flavus TaxID=1076124 RepID=A0A6F8XRP8_9ACTN|nr:(2Fe-2S)-binding protein [Phytohabitans flavus]BCB76421.1 hypothetical protein Pflav_028310 [Phytohabitans flavus]